MIFSLCFLFFKRSMQIPIKILTGSIQEIEYFTFSYIHGSRLFILWFHCGFCNKKGTFRVFTGFGHLQTSETSGRNMTVELDSRHSLLPKTGWGKMKIWLILRGGIADTSALNAVVKEKNTKTNKITIVKNQKLATQNFLFNVHINFPFGNIFIKTFPFMEYA